MATDESKSFPQNVLGDKEDVVHSSEPKQYGRKNRSNRNLSPIYQGVYIPDKRFNAFVDGVMVNMIAEMRRRRMDPLYFRVLDKDGKVEHVPTHRGARQSRQRNQEAIGGGVIRGLSRIRRFGNSEVQVAGNSTLVRSHYIIGPLDLEISYGTPEDTKVITSTIPSIAGHGVVEITNDTSEFKTLDFLIDSPEESEIPLAGSKNNRIRRLSKETILNLLKPYTTLETRLFSMFKKGSKLEDRLENRLFRTLKKSSKFGAHLGNRIFKIFKRASKNPKIKFKLKKNIKKKISKVPLLKTVHENVLEDFWDNITVAVSGITSSTPIRNVSQEEVTEELFSGNLDSTTTKPLPEISQTGISEELLPDNVDSSTTTNEPSTDGAGLLDLRIGIDNYSNDNEI